MVRKEILLIAGAVVLAVVNVIVLRGAFKGDSKFLVPKAPEGKGPPRQRGGQWAGGRDLPQQPPGGEGQGGEGGLPSGMDRRSPQGPTSGPLADVMGPEEFERLQGGLPSGMDRPSSQGSTSGPRASATGTMDFNRSGGGMPSVGPATLPHLNGVGGMAPTSPDTLEILRRIKQPEAPDMLTGSARQEGSLVGTAEAQPAKPDVLTASAPHPGPWDAKGTNDGEPQLMVVDLMNKSCPVKDEKALEDQFLDYKGLRVHFCSRDCDLIFLKDPDRFLMKLGIDDAKEYFRKHADRARPLAELSWTSSGGHEPDSGPEAGAGTVDEAGPSKGSIIDLRNRICPVMGGPVQENIHLDFRGVRIHFSCWTCDLKFLERPEACLAKIGIHDLEAYKRDNAYRAMLPEAARAWEPDEPLD